MQGEIYAIDRDDSQILIKLTVNIPRIKYPTEIEKSDFKKKIEYSKIDGFEEQVKAQQEFVSQVRLGLVNIEYTKVEKE